ncbi:MAG: TIGR02452 family protein [Clostridiales bacterium]|jgi:uncharacterized protein (TIGR02452 family)|nr:TIGR02452 family protein [Clostridiales bacterium]
MERAFRIEASKKVLEVFKQGYYYAGAQRVDVSPLHQATIRGVKLYEPLSFETLALPSPSTAKAKCKMAALGTVEALQKLRKDGSTFGILNFASARKPGGGFLNGAIAQEECLSQSSNLYQSLLEAPKFYEKNKANVSSIYLDYMIYSKGVVFIRDDTGPFWRTLLTANVLTVPAVNMGQYIAKGIGPVKDAQNAMKSRISKLLRAFAAEGDKRLILGAFGCGVFKNEPALVSSFFKDALEGEGLAHYFDEIYFAIPGCTSYNFRAFEKIFGDAQ